MIARLKNRINREEFLPSPFFGLMVNPFYYSRKSLRSSIERLSPAIQGKTLDAGCGTKPYRKFFMQSYSYIGMEIEASKPRLGSRVDVYYSGAEFPFESNSFDSLVSFQVLEHVPDPRFFIKEIHRVLKANGVALVTVPFAWEEHEEPYDFTRFTSFGLKDCFKNAGFEILEYEKVCTGFKAIIQIFTGMLTVKNMKQPKVLRHFFQLFLIFPIHALSYMISFWVPGTSRIYLDNAILVKKL